MNATAFATALWDEVSSSYTDWLARICTFYVANCYAVRPTTSNA